MIQVNKQGPPDDHQDITSFPRIDLDQGHGWQKPGRHRKKKGDYMIWLDLVKERGRKKGRLLEYGVIPAEPDVVAGVDAQTRDVLLKVAKFDSRFAKPVHRVWECVWFCFEMCKCVCRWEISVCRWTYLFVLFVNFCQQWAWGFENVELFVCLV